MELDKKKIIEFQKNRDPYLMIDHATEVLPGKSAKGYKILDPSEWFFKCHWQGDPNMPGMLQIEAMVQLAALMILTLPGFKGKVMYLASADKLLFKKKIIPGQTLQLETSLESWKRGIAKCNGKGMVENELACSAKFVITEPSTLSKFRI